MTIVAIPKETGFGYEWIASFEDENKEEETAAAESYSIKFADSIVIYNVKL